MSTCDYLNFIYFIIKIYCLFKLPIISDAELIKKQNKQLCVHL